MEQEYSSTVSYVQGDKTHDVNYVYTIHVPKINDSYSVTCPTPGAPPTATITVSRPTVNTQVFSNPVQDVRLRQAIAYCTDRHALTQTVYPTLSSTQIDELVMDSFLRKSHWAYVQPAVQYRYDPLTGQALLDQAGWAWSSGRLFRTN